MGIWGRFLSKYKVKVKTVGAGPHQGTGPRGFKLRNEPPFHSPVL